MKNPPTNTKESTYALMTPRTLSQENKPQGGVSAAHTLQSMRQINSQESHR